MKALKLLGKFALVGGLIYFLVRRGLLSISISNTGTALSRLDEIIPAMLALFAGTVLSIFRWKILLEAHGIRLGWVRTLELTFVGNFFNIALPGAVSGDLVKALYVAKDVKGLRAKAFGSILFDRIAGVSALVLVAAGALVVGFDHFWGTPLIQAIRVFLGTSAAGFIVFYAYLFLMDPKHDPVHALLRRLEKKMPKLGSLFRIYEGVKDYSQHRLAVTKAVAISMCVHLLVAFACWRFTYALGDPTVPLLAIMVVVPLGLLVIAIPILPGGIGTGHVAFGYLFQLLGSKLGADVFTLFALYGISVGLLGGLSYLRFKSEGSLPDLKQARA